VPRCMDRSGQLGAAALERMREPGGRDQAAGGRLLGERARASGRRHRRALVPRALIGERPGRRFVRQR